MKKTFVVISFLLVFLNSCDKKTQLPDGFEVVWNEANIFFVYLHENLRGRKSDQRRACTVLCDSKEFKECEVYMWSKRDIIPKGLPIRNAGSFVHSYFKRTSAGKKKYKCQECK